MTLEKNMHSIEFFMSESLLSTLGIRIIPSPHDSQGSQNYKYSHNTVMASMPVDKRTVHPFGFLSGGASLALAESLAGYGSFLLCKEGEFPNGIQVSANHVKNVPFGQSIQATAILIHKGKTTHVWNIDITNEEGALVSSARVTNLIINKKSSELS